MTDDSSSAHRWAAWAVRIRALADTGLAYSQDMYDRQRYEELRDLALTMTAELADAPLDKVRGLLQLEPGYVTPKVDVRGAVFEEGRVLLVREASDGLWTLPGGWADVGESAREAVERETREESGYEVRATKLVAVYDRARHGHPPQAIHAYKLFFLCERTGGAPRASAETTEVAFHPLETLPALSLMRVTTAQIQRLSEHIQHPEWPTDFD
jgi:ADP-ribose pyrophosphatase YjhB (NUDIX family)